MKYVALLACVVSLSLLNGCIEPSPPLTPAEVEAQVEAELQEYGAVTFPDGAMKVMDLGNGWHTFELETDGVTRKFLFHRTGDYSGECSWAQESITEISPAPLP